MTHAWLAVVAGMALVPLVTWWPMLALQHPGWGLPLYPPPVGVDLWQSQVYWLATFVLVGAIVGARDRWLGVTLVVAGVTLFWRGPLLPALGLTRGVDPTHAVLFALGALALWGMRQAPRSAWPAIRWVLVASGLLQTLYALQQKFLHYDLLWGPVFGGTLNAVIQPLGTLGTVDATAAYIAITAPLMPAWMLPLPIVAVWTSQSMGANVALALGLVLRFCWGHRDRMIAAALVAIPAALYFLTYVKTMNKVWPRLSMWAFGLWDAAHLNPITGYGLGGWSVRVPKIQLQTGFSPTNELWAQAHSEPVQWACELGLVGLILLGGWLWSHRAMFAHPTLGPSCAALGVTCTSFFTFHVVATALLGIVLVGLATPHPILESGD